MVHPPLPIVPIKDPVEDHNLATPDSESVRTCPLMWFAGLLVDTTEMLLTPSNSYAVQSNDATGCGRKEWPSQKPGGRLSRSPRKLEYASVLAVEQGDVYKCVCIIHVDKEGDTCIRNRRHFLA